MSTLTLKDLTVPEELADQVLEALQLASEYMNYVKREDRMLHAQADGQPSAQESVSAAIIAIEIQLIAHFIRSRLPTRR